MEKPPRLDEALHLARNHLAECGADFALVGGLAVTVRTRPRFTEDIDFALAVHTDEEAERLVHALVSRGYRIDASVEHEVTGRLVTIRLLRPDTPEALIDLLFASSGIEREVVAQATTLKVLGRPLKVATVGHLVAMKVLSRDEKSRPNDTADLVNLLSVATAGDLEQAREALRLIESRGCARGKDLLKELAQVEGGGDGV